MMADFGITCESLFEEPGAVATLQLAAGTVIPRRRKKETAVLIVDEAQNLSDEVPRRDSPADHLETFTEKLLQIVLVGQPELEGQTAAAAVAAVAAAGLRLRAQNASTHAGRGLAPISINGCRSPVSNGENDFRGLKSVDFDLTAIRAGNPPCSSNTMPVRACGW